MGIICFLPNGIDRDSFVGLTPGILVSYAVFRWALGVLGNRKGLRLGRRHDELKYALR